MKKALICGYFGFYNFGDELLLHTIIRDLGEISINQNNITAISNNTSETKAFHGINAVNRWNILEIINSIISNDVLIFIGGLFQDKTSFRSFLYYYFILFIGYIFNKQIVFYGVGIGPFLNKISKLLFDFIIKKIQFITIRDNSSGYFATYSEHILTTIDPAWTVVPNFNIKGKIKTINWEKPIVGISLRNHKNLTSKHIEFFGEKIAKILQDYDEWQVLFLPCMPEQDLHISYSLYDYLVKKYSEKRVHIISDLNDYPIDEQVGLFASCDVMFSMRYHALLTALANGKPVLGVVCDPKIKSLCEFASQVNFKLQDALQEPWGYFWQNLEHSTEKAKEASKKAKELHAKNLELLFRLNEVN